MTPIRVSVASTLTLLSVSLFSANSMAQQYSVSVRDVSHEYKASILPTPPPTKPGGPGGIAGDIPVISGGPVLPTASPAPTVDPGTSSSPTTPTGSTYDPSTATLPGQLKTVGDFLIMGKNVWDFIVNNKPNADYKALSASVLPSGVDYTKVRWTRGKAVSKQYRVEFKNRLGGSAGGFDYQISYAYGGTYAGKGKYLQKITVVPTKINLKTDRNLTFRAEMSDPMNYGEEYDPIPGVQIMVSWSSPTTTRYEMTSVTYMIYGDGEIERTSN